MSAETESAVIEAVRQHVADVMPDYPLLAAVYAIAACVGEDTESTGYLHISTPQATHVSMGLVHIGQLRLEGR